MHKNVKWSKSSSFTFINLVSISPSEASSWCLRTYLWHLDRAFSFGVDTLIALGMIGCITVSRSKLEAGLWSTHFSPPAECERLCIGWTGGTVWWSQSEKQKSVIGQQGGLIMKGGQLLVKRTVLLEVEWDISRWILLRLCGNHSNCVSRKDESAIHSSNHRTFPKSEIQRAKITKLKDG